MIVPRYAPGEWFAVVTDGTVAVLAPCADPSLVQAVWASLRDGGSLTEQVHLLLRDGIAVMPPFALVSVEGGKVHAIVRGGIEVAVTTSTGVTVLSGVRVTTWAESTVEGVLSVAVQTPSAELAEAVEGTPSGPGPRRGPGSLPVLSAVVRAAGVRVELRTADDQDAHQEEPSGAFARAPGATAEPQPQPAHQPEPQPTPTPAHQPEPTPHPEPTPELEAPPARDDHDGMTVLSSDVVALRRQLPDWAGDAVPGPFAVPAPQTPPPAKLLLSSGLVVSLNRPVLLGRAPQVSRVTNRELPRLVTVASPNQDISRTHAEVRMDGEDVLVTDLRSTNGILVLRQGAGPQRLHPGEPTVVEPGVVVDLGEGVTFTVERGA